MGLKPRPFRTALHLSFRLVLGVELPTPANLATALELLNAGCFCLEITFAPDNYRLTLFVRDRITSGDKPVCIYPFATDYHRGYRLGRRPVTYEWCTTTR